MRIRFGVINTYLALAALLGLMLGCANPEERAREETYGQLWFHLEVTPGPHNESHIMPVQVAGVKLMAETRPFITEDHIINANVVETPQEGYALRVEFDDHGKLVLDTLTSANRGRCLVIYAQFGDRRKPDKNEPDTTVKRWLAAPRLNQRISNGVIIFTPDATRQELDRLVLGLKNVAHENAKPWVF